MAELEHRRLTKRAFLQSMVLGAGANLLAACAPVRSSPPSRAEAERQTGATIQTPNPGGNPVGKLESSPSPTPVIEWDLEESKAGEVIVNAKFPTTKEPGLINVFSPLDSIIPNGNLTDIVTLNNQLNFSYRLADVNGTLATKLELRRQLPPLESIRDKNWGALDPRRIRHTVIVAFYDNSGFLGPLTLGIKF